VSLNLNSNKFYELMGCLRFLCIDHLETIDILKVCPHSRRKSPTPPSQKSGT
jgi:hypothetical protein